MGTAKPSHADLGEIEHQLRNFLSTPQLAWGTGLDNNMERYISWTNIGKKHEAILFF